MHKIINLLPVNTNFFKQDKTHDWGTLALWELLMFRVSNLGYVLDVELQWEFHPVCLYALQTLVRILTPSFSQTQTLTHAVSMLGKHRQLNTDTHHQARERWSERKTPRRSVQLSEDGAVHLLPRRQEEFTSTRPPMGGTELSVCTST